MTESPPGPPPGTKGSRPRWAAGAAGLIAVLIALVLQLAFAIRSDGLTTDELVYIAAGWRQLSAGDHSFNYETPPLAKLLAAAAASTLRLRDPPVPPGGVDLEWAYRFFHVENEPGPVLWRARIPAAAFTVLLA